MIANPYQQYINQSISTLTPVQAVIALYDKAEQETNKAIYYVENKQMDKANDSIKKVQNIVMSLNANLNMNYDMSKNLAQLYEYINHSLFEANVHKDIEILKSLLPFFKDLKEAFTEISRKGK